VRFLKAGILSFTVCWASAAACAAEPQLLLQTSFETDPRAEGWAFGTGGGSEGIWDDSVAHTGNRAVKITGNGSGQWAAWSSPLRRVEPGERFRVVAWIKTEGAQWGVPLVTVAWWEGGQYRGGGPGSPATWSPEWARRETIVTVPEGVHEMQVSCHAGGNPGTTWYDDVELWKLPEVGLWLSAQIDAPEQIFRPAEQPSLEVTVKNPADASRKVTLRAVLRNWQDQEVETLTRELALGPGAAETLSLPAPAARGRLGAYSWHVTVHEGDLLLGQQLATFSVLPDEPPRPHDPFSVIACNDMPHTTNLEITREVLRAQLRRQKEMGVNTCRLWLSWDSVEREPGQNQWPEWLDWYGPLAREMGVKLLLVLWCRPPAWASEIPARDPHNQFPFVDEFARFVAAAVTRYGDWVDVFEIHNEPHASQYYLDLLKAGYLAAKKARPDRQVIHAGFYWYHRQTHEGLFAYGDVLIHALASLARDYTEGMNWHEYYHSVPEEPLTRDLGTHKNILDGRMRGSYGAELWMTEMSWGAAYQRPYPDYVACIGAVPYPQQAAYTARLYLTTWAEGYGDLDTKAFWYLFKDSQPVPFFGWTINGPVDWQFGRKPGFCAVRALDRELGGASYVGPFLTPPPLGPSALHALVFRHGKIPVTALWTEQDEALVTLKVGAPEVTVTDTMGNRETRTTENGVLTLALGPGPVYVRGGSEELLLAALRGRLRQVTEECRSLAGKLEIGALAGELERVLNAANEALGRPTPDPKELANAAHRVGAFARSVLDTAERQALPLDRAAALLNVLRVRDVLWEGHFLLLGEEDIVGVKAAVAATRQRYEELRATVDPLRGYAKTKVLLRLVARRLAQADRRCAAGQPSDAARLNALCREDLDLAERLRHWEEGYRLSVWIALEPYLLSVPQGTSGTLWATVRNTEEAEVSGTLTLRPPEGWTVAPAEVPFTIPAGGKVELPLKVTAGEGAEEAVGEIWVSGHVGTDLLVPNVAGVQGVGEFAIGDLRLAI